MSFFSLKVKVKLEMHDEQIFYDGDENVGLIAKSIFSVFLRVIDIPHLKCFNFKSVSEGKLESRLCLLNFVLTECCLNEDH